LAEDNERADIEAEYEAVAVGTAQADPEMETQPTAAPAKPTRQRATPTVKPADADVLAMLESLKSDVNDSPNDPQ
jgi:hypothetical protein